MRIRAITIGLMFLALLGMQNGVHAADKVLRVVRMRISTSSIRL